MPTDHSRCHQMRLSQEVDAYLGNTLSPEGGETITGIPGI